MTTKRKISETDFKTIWTREATEWQDIAIEMTTAAHKQGRSISAFEVSQEQAKRANERGETLLNFDALDIIPNQPS